MSEWMKGFSKTLLTLSGLATTFVGLLAIASIVEGFVFYCLWGWFLLPLGMPTINLPQAMGIGLTISFLTYHCYPFKKEEEVGVLDTLEHLLVRPVITLSLGWILHFFV